MIVHRRDQLILRAPGVKKRLAAPLADLFQRLEAISNKRGATDGQPLHSASGQFLQQILRLRSNPGGAPEPRLKADSVIFFPKPEPGSDRPCRRDAMSAIAVLVDRRDHLAAVGLLQTMALRFVEPLEMTDRQAVVTEKQMVGPYVLKMPANVGRLCIQILRTVIEWRNQRQPVDAAKRLRFGARDDCRRLVARLCILRIERDRDDLCHSGIQQPRHSRSNRRLPITHANLDHVVSTHLLAEPLREVDGVDDQWRALRCPDRSVELCRLIFPARNDDQIDEKPAEWRGYVDHLSVHQKLFQVGSNRGRLRRRRTAQINQQNSGLRHNFSSISSAAAAERSRILARPIPPR